MIRPLRELVGELRAKAIAEAVLQTGNVSAAARALKIHRNAIYRELRLNGSHLTISKLRAQRKLKFSATKSQHS